MTLGLCFWVIIVVAVVFGVLSHFGVLGGSLAILIAPVVLLVLIILLGWQVFGPPLHR